MHGLAGNDAGRLDVDAGALRGVDRALAVDGVAERVDDAAEQFAPTGTSTMAPVRLTVWPSMMSRSAPKITTPTLSASRLRAMPLHAVLEFDRLAGLNIVEAINAGDAVANRQNLANLADLSLIAEICDLVLEDRGNFRGADITISRPLSCVCEWN